MTKPCANPACLTVIERPAWRFRRVKHPTCGKPACRRAVLDARTAFAHRFLRDGMWWVKLRMDDPSHGRGDGRGYAPAHIVVVERLLGRRIQGHERVRWLSGNRLDVTPQNLVLSTPTGYVLVRDLSAPKADPAGAY